MILKHNTVNLPADASRITRVREILFPHHIGPTTNVGVVFSQSKSTEQLNQLKNAMIDTFDTCAMVTVCDMNEMTRFELQHELLSHDQSTWEGEHIPSLDLILINDLDSKAMKNLEVPFNSNCIINYDAVPRELYEDRIYTFGFPLDNRDEFSAPNNFLLAMQKFVKDEAMELKVLLKRREYKVKSNKIDFENVSDLSTLRIRKKLKPKIKEEKEEEMPTWVLKDVLAGHTGVVHSVAVDPTNRFFVTGAADRTIKFCILCLELYRGFGKGLVLSRTSPYLFSCGEDKTVKCWDLETNKVIRGYHGHLSGVYCIDIHPMLDILFTGGRDSAVRVWDVRTRAQIGLLGGHRNTVASVACQADEPQVISGSHDTTARLWDLCKMEKYRTLTHHKKSIRGLCINPSEYTFCTGGSDNLKIWKCPEGKFLRNQGKGHGGIVNCVAVNQSNVLVSGGDNGILKFWNYKTGKCTQEVFSKPQPGSLDSEAGIIDMKFDMTGTRLITTEWDKSVKVWKIESQ